MDLASCHSGAAIKSSLPLLNLASAVSGMPVSSQVSGSSWPWLHLRPKPSLLTCLPMTRLLVWYHGSVSCQWDSLPHLPCPSPWTPDLLSCRAAGSGCSLALDSCHLHPRYARASFYSLQCWDAEQIIKNKRWFVKVIQTHLQVHKRSNFLIEWERFWKSLKILKNYF